MSESEAKVEEIDAAKAEKIEEIKAEAEKIKAKMQLGSKKDEKESIETESKKNLLKKFQKKKKKNGELHIFLAVTTIL